MAALQRCPRRGVGCGSVAFVSVCSLYANLASDLASWRSDVNPQLDRIEERLKRIEALLCGK